MKFQPRPKAQSGFSVVEVLLTLALLSFLGTMTMQTFRNWLPRLDLRASTQQTHALINKARLEAIQRGVTTTVQVDDLTGVIIAFADVNGDPLVGSSGYASYLKYDPDPLAGEKQTDYEIGRLYLSETTLGATGFSPVNGFTAVPGAFNSGLVFSASGVPLDIGAFRLADRSGRNIFEIAVASLAGKVEIRKYLDGTDSPTSSAGFFTRGTRRSGENIWVWY